MEERLPKNSSRKTIFNSYKPEYEKNLKWSGFKTNFKYEKATKSTCKTESNPPHSKNVTSKTAKSFLFLLNKHLPKYSKPHKIVNRNTVKASSGYTENIGSIQQKSDQINL